MAFNKHISGFENEDEFVKLFHKRRFRELNPLEQLFLNDLFENVKDNDIVYCYKSYEKKKADIFIRVRTVTKGISIKKGIKNSVHTEPIRVFIDFLKECGVNDDVINAYLRYHYADGSIDGTGKHRMSSEEYKIEHQKEIDIINEAFNKEEILKKAAYRFVLQGNNSFQSIDAILYGVDYDFLWIKKDDIARMIISRQNLNASGVHFGPLFCQPQSRCLNYNSKYEKDRYVVQLKWYHLSDDIIENMNWKVCNHIN